MAEEEVNDVEEEKAEAQKKSFPVKMLVISVLFLFLFGGGLIVWKGGLLAKLLEKEEEKTAAIQKGGGDPNSGIGPIYPMETFIVNLLDPHGKRFLKARLSLELDNELAIAEVERRLPQFRDSILTMLASKMYKDIIQLEGKYQLRAEMMMMLNRYLNSGKIKNIYFTEFIIQ
jgi:flagellar FliL protein